MVTPKKQKENLAIENVSFKDAMFIINNKIVIKSSSFSDNVSKPKLNTVREPSSTFITISNKTFPNLSQSYGIRRKLTTMAVDFKPSQKSSRPEIYNTVIIILSNFVLIIFSSTLFVNCRNCNNSKLIKKQKTLNLNTLHYKSI